MNKTEPEYDFDPTTDVKKAMSPPKTSPWKRTTENFDLDPASFGGEDFPSWDPNDLQPMDKMPPLHLGPIVTPELEADIKRVYDNNPHLRQKSNDPWIQTYSGRRFNPLNPYEGAIVLDDIAHALSMQCRFSGHVKKFYSVAQHCVLVSYICDSADALSGLLHDASEAYLVDIPSPLKRSPTFEAYRELESKMQKMICKRFGLSEEEPISVKKADRMLLATEARDLMAPLHRDWIQPCDPLPFKIDPLPQREAKDLFMKRFFELTNADGGYEHYLSIENRA